MAGFLPWAAMGAKPVRYDTLENTPYAPRTGMPPQQGAPLVPLQMPPFAALPSYGPTPGELTQTAVNQEALQNTAPGSGGQAAMALSGAGTPVRRNAEDPDMQRYIDYLNQLDTKGKEVVAAQQAGVDQYGRSLEATKALPGQLDLSPLMALSDTWYGGNLSKGYTKPASTEQRTQDIMALQNALSRQKAGVSETELGLIKQRLGGEEALAGMKNAREMAALRRQEHQLAKDQRQDFKDAQEDQRQVESLAKNNDFKAMQGMIDANEAIGKLKKFISEKGLPNILSNSADLNTFNALYASAKLSIKKSEDLGALTTSDVDITEGMLGPDGTVLDGIKQAYLGGDPTLIRALDTITDRYDKNFADKKTVLSKVYTRPRAIDILDTEHARLKSLNVTKTSEGTVKIKAPDGEIRAVPASQKQAYLDKGGVLAE